MVENELVVCAIIVINGRIKCDPKYVSVMTGVGAIGCEAQSVVGETRLDEVFETRLEERGFTLLQAADVGVIEVKADNIKVFRAACCRHATEMPEA
jgi:hypothetical protein